MRKKNEARRFARWCFSKLNLRPIPICYAPAPALIDPNGNHCFGCYTYDVEEPAWKSKIWVAYNQRNTVVLLGTIAHEIWHYWQKTQGIIDTMDPEKMENEAQEAAEHLVALWLIRGGFVPTKEGKEYVIDREERSPSGDQ